MTPYKTNKIKAVSELRKLVYYLSENVDPRSLWIVRAQAGIEHLELKGTSSKEVITNLFIDCQEQSTLKDFVSGLIDHKKIGAEALDLDCFEEIGYNFPDLRNVSFEISKNETCLYLDQSSNKLVHQPVYGVRPHPQENCTYIKYCKVCGKEISTLKNHEFGEWRYCKPNSCEMVRQCSKCGKTETKTNHQWLSWHTNINGSKYRVCEHCKLEEINVDGVWKGTVNWENGHKDYWEVEIKTSGFLWETTKAEIKVYVNVVGNQCDYTVVQKASVSISGKSIKISGKKILESSGPKKGYVLDTFNGVIQSKCEALVGKVCDGSLCGELTLK